MTEIRTTSATGGQKGVKPERHDLLPRKGLDAISRVFGFGAQKYADHNWRNRYEWGKSLAAIERHIGAFMDGETYDPESGLPHLAHAGFHILVLLTWLEEDGEGVENEMDDRWPAAMERRRLEAELESTEVSLEHLALAIGVPADALREQVEHHPFTSPTRFIKEVKFTAEPTEPYLAAERDPYAWPSLTPTGDIPTRPYDQSYEDWVADQNTNIVTGQDGVQRSFDRRG